ncbi:MAG: hypothetical protein ACO1NO_10225 [Burkholderiaceae bacterium]
MLGQRLPDQAGKQFSMVDTPDHWGSLMEASVSLKGGKLAVNLPPMSYSKIVLRAR